MRTWILISIVTTVVAAAITAIVLSVLYLKKRAKLKANIAYQQSLVDQALVAKQVAEQTSIVKGIVDESQGVLDDAKADQNAAFSELAQTNRELEDLKKNLATAIIATNTLAAKENAEDVLSKASQNEVSSRKDLSIVQKTAETIKEKTAEAIETVTDELKKQNEALASFRKQLQDKTIKEAAKVNNPTITPPVLDSKPSVRDIWDAAIQALVSSSSYDVTIKLLSKIYTVTQKDANDLIKAADAYKKPTKCDIVSRIFLEGKWTCPPGYSDTGRDWGDIDGYKQCQRGPCSELPENKCTYTRKIEKNGSYVCPMGYKDTGRPATSDYQCSIGPCGATPADPPQPCVYSSRVFRNSNWVCPEGMIDTGLNWGDVDGGTKQCRTSSCPQPEKRPLPPPSPTPSPAPSPAPSGNWSKSQNKGQFVLTWYSANDNTPPNSNISSKGKELVPYVSLAVPSRYIKNGTFNYGDIIYVDFLNGRMMPNGQKHNGLVRIDDFCGDHGDDDYCFQNYKGKKYPNVDIYIGEYRKSGMGDNCSGPAGSGQELTDVFSTSGNAQVGSWGGQSRPDGKCGDLASAKAGKPGRCWFYTPTPEGWWSETCRQVKQA